MAENKYVDFIRKIFEKTKANSIEWDYLDSNKSLYRRMEWNNYSGGAAFDIESSFWSVIDGYYIVLFTEEGSLTDLYVIPNTFKNIVVLEASKYGEFITRLYNLVRGQFPDADSFIDRIIQE